MIQSVLGRSDYASIVNAAANDKRVLSRLLAQTYAADDVTGWRAVQALGLASARVAERDAEFVRCRLYP